MSTFICSNNHIAALALFAAQPLGFSGRPLVDPRYIEGLKETPLLGEDLAQQYFNILERENVRSVNYRYEHHGNPEGAHQAPVAERAGNHYSIVQILKLANCLEYQSCESPDWGETLAFRLLRAIKEAAITRLPGYDSAEWAV